MRVVGWSGCCDVLIISKNFSFLRCGVPSFLTIDAFDYRDMAEDQVSKSTAALKQPHLMGLC